MKRWLLVTLIGIALLVAALVALAPASLVMLLLDGSARTGGVVSETDGTIWRGRTVIVGDDVRIPVVWTLDPLSLVAGKAKVRVAPADPAGPPLRADVSATPDRVELSGVDLALPAATRQRMLQKDASRTLWQAGGEVAARTPRLDWTPAAFQGDVDLAWRNARLQFGARAVDLGEIGARLTAQGDRLAGPLDNRGGELDVRGDVAIATNGATTLALVLTPRRADDAGLALALAALGTRDGAGYRVNVETRPR
jgi:hypothetical protein